LEPDSDGDLREPVEFHRIDRYRFFAFVSVHGRIACRLAKPDCSRFGKKSVEIGVAKAQWIYRKDGERRSIYQRRSSSKALEAIRSHEAGLPVPTAHPDRMDFRRMEINDRPVRSDLP